MMMKRVLFLSACLLPAIPAGAAEGEVSGSTVFQRHCAACHAPGLDRPGTLQLSLTRGEANAVLEQRQNLNAEYVKFVVREGLNAMPPFKPSVIPDQELNAIANYLGGN